MKTIYGDSNGQMPEESYRLNSIKMNSLDVFKRFVTSRGADSIEIIRNTIEKRIRDSIISRKSFSEYGKSMVTNHADVNNDK